MAWRRAWTVQVTVRIGWRRMAVSALGSRARYGQWEVGRKKNLRKNYKLCIIFYLFCYINSISFLHRKKDYNVNNSDVDYHFWISLYSTSDSQSDLLISTRPHLKRGKIKNFHARGSLDGRPKFCLQELGITQIKFELVSRGLNEYRVMCYGDY